MFTKFPFNTRGVLPVVVTVRAPVFLLPQTGIDPWCNIGTATGGIAGIQ